MIAASQQGATTLLHIILSLRLVQALRDDKNEIFRAAHDASAAADFVLSLDRERVNVAEEHRQSEPEREMSRFVARLDAGSGDVGVHDKRFGNDHHTPIDHAGSSSQEGRANHNNRSEVSESLQEARALAIKELGREARIYIAQIASGVYYGKIIGETDHHVVQRLSGQTAVAHLKKLLAENPKLKSNVSISYGGEKARVRDIPERSKTAELAR